MVLHVCPFLGQRSIWGLVIHCGINRTVVVDDIELFYGTTSTSEVISCAAIGAIFCDACCQERDATTLECVEDCAEGQTMRSGYCYDVSEPEPKCVVREFPTESDGGNGAVILSSFNFVLAA